MSELLDPSTISQEWQIDAQIDDTLLDESSMRIPCLHAKYLDYLATIRKQLRQLERKKKAIPAAERRSDDRYEKVCESIDEHKDAADYLEKIIYNINGMSYSIGNAIKWRMFNAGLNP